MAGITTTHAQYESTRAQWERIRDAVAGSDAVKARGSTYLPALSEQTRDEYAAYLTRAMYFNTPRRTVQALLGAVMRKDPSITIPSILAPFIQDATCNGVSFNALTKTTLGEVLQTGRCGVLVDMPTQADEPARPYCVLYQAESIVNWSDDMTGGVPVLRRVILLEHVHEEDATDPYVMKTIEQYRELYLEDGIYHQQLWRKQRHLQRGTDEWVRYEDAITPVVKGAPFDFIPFCFFSPTTLTAAVEIPPLLDLCDVAISHFRSSADLEHGRHHTALPTPWITGLDNKNASLKIGSTVAWVIPPDTAKVGMLEFTGQGLGTLEKALEHKERLMAVLGARLLEEQKKTVESSDTLAMRYSGEQSVLRSAANTVSDGLSQCLQWAALWTGVKPEAAAKAVVRLNTDFIDNQMSFAEMTELVKSWQAGAISYDTMYALMEKGEVTRPGITAEKEQAQIEIERPAQLPQNINPMTGLPDPELNAE